MLWRKLKTSAAVLLGMAAAACAVLTFDVAADQSAGPVQPASGIKSDEDKLQGAWVLIALERKGKAQPIPRLTEHRMRYVIAGHKLRATWMGTTNESSFMLLSTSDPKQIDMTAVKLDTVARGIYALQDENLILCVALDGKERPTEFATDPAGRTMLMVFRRDQQ